MKFLIHFNSSPIKAHKARNTIPATDSSYRSYCFWKQYYCHILIQPFNALLKLQCLACYIPGFSCGQGSVQFKCPLQDSFSLLDGRNIHLTNQHCPICPLKLNNEPKDVKSAASIIRYQMLQLRYH